MAEAFERMGEHPCHQVRVLVSPGREPPRLHDPYSVNMDLPAAAENSQISDLCHMRTAAPIFFLLLCLACRKPEPVEHARYLIDNRSDMGLRIQVEPSPNLLWALITDTVPPNSKVHFQDVSMGSGGHLMPGNFYRSFRLTAGDTVIYEGVRNNDWILVGRVKGKLHYELVVE
jgi:hypothetical protein